MKSDHSKQSESPKSLPAKGHKKNPAMSSKTEVDSAIKFLAGD